MELICLGELLIDFVPTVSGVGLRDVQQFEKAPGGAPANVAVGFSQLGGESGFIGKVGADDFGSALIETLHRHGVDTTGVIQTSEALTMLAFVSLRSDGERDFVFYRNPSADMLLRPEEVNDAVIVSSPFFHFGSISLISEPARTATLKAAQIASEHGRIVSFDPNLRPPLWPSLGKARHEMLDAMSRVSLLKVSEEELSFITGQSLTNEGISYLFDRFASLRLIAVTRGGEGCYLAFRDHTLTIPGFAVRAVDTTGAGDGFTAGLLYQISRAPFGDVPWEACDDLWCSAGRFANAVGALVVTRKGGIPAMPCLDEVLRLVGTVS